MDVRLIKAIIHDFVKLQLHFSFPHKTTDVLSQLAVTSKSNVMTSIDMEEDLA